MSSSRARKSKSFRGPEERGCSKKFLLIILIVFIGLAAIGIALGVGIPSYLANQRRIAQEKLAKKIEVSMPILLNNMNTDLDPCTDFYQFSCDGFLQNISSLEFGQIGMNSKIQTDILSNIMDLLNSPVTDKDPEFYRKLKTFYDSCMNEEKLKLLHDKPIIELFDELGGWPFLVGPTWTSNADNWMDLLIKVNKKQILGDFFMEVTAMENIFDESSFSLMIGQPQRLGISPIAYHQKIDFILKLYRDYFTKVVRYLSTQSYDIESDLNEVLDLEARLADIIDLSTPKLQLYEEMNISQLNEEIQTDLYPLLKSLLPYEIDLSQRILVRNVNYFRQFADIIKTVNMRVITNYVLWVIVSSNILYLDQDAIEIQNDFKRVLERVETSRQKRCADDSALFLFLALNSIYVRKFTNRNLKPMATEFVLSIRSVFEEEIDAISWMDAETKKVAKNKLDYIKYFIAYPDEMYDDSALNSYYAQLSLDKERWFQNVLNAKWQTRQQTLKLLTNGDSLRWTRRSDILTLAASYSAKNELKITLPYLQGIYYEPDGLKTVNFGGLGNVVGHEFFHAIDLEGSKFNAQGIKDPWWSNETSEMFEERRQCFVDQYGDYTVEIAIPQINEINVDNRTSTSPTKMEYKVNGELTAAENMADNMGLTVAYKAFTKWLDKNPEERTLPGVQFTPQQLFWISFASKYCSYMSPSMAALQLKNNHSPDRYRVLGPIQNHPQFLKDFNCNASTPSSLRCSID